MLSFFIQMRLGILIQANISGSHFILLVSLTACLRPYRQPDDQRER
ncbi:hypothetical protein B4100_0898 [Heyndrickxia coagulans]|nr:hypothetical protein B4100_0898 [Heyndrickxia coagulans]